MDTFLVATGQALALFALLYGAYFLVSRGPQPIPLHVQKARRDAARSVARARTGAGGEHDRE